MLDLLKAFLEALLSIIVTAAIFVIPIGICQYIVNKYTEKKESAAKLTARQREQHKNEQEYQARLYIENVRLEQAVAAALAAAGADRQTIVFDPFLGSGTTAVVAVKNKRSCIGIEINPMYVDMAERRVKQEVATNE